MTDIFTCLGSIHITWFQFKQTRQFFTSKVSVCFVVNWRSD